MKSEELVNKIAYCGLICRLCYRAADCDGCRQSANACERNCSDEGCYQRNCCIGKGLAGCWECAGLSDCNEGIYSDMQNPKVKAFALCIQQDGVENFIAYVARNLRHGLSVEKGRDYDFKPVPEVLKLLRTGSYSSVLVGKE